MNYLALRIIISLYRGIGMVFGLLGFVGLAFALENAAQIRQLIGWGESFNGLVLLLIFAGFLLWEFRAIRMYAQGDLLQIAIDVENNTQRTPALLSQLVARRERKSVAPDAPAPYKLPRPNVKWDMGKP